MDGVFLSTNGYETLLKKASFSTNFKNDLIRIRSHISNLPEPEMNPTAFERICQDVGAENLYRCIKDECLTNANIRAKFAQWFSSTLWCIPNPKDKFFSSVLSRTLQQFGISEQGLQSL